MTAIAVPLPRRHSLLRPYLGYVAMGARQEVQARAALVGRAAFLVVILFVFSRIWALVADSGALTSRTQAELIWYLAVTELVLLSFPMVHLEMENDFKTGEMLVRLPQPVSYPWARLAEGAGGALVRLAAFIPIAVFVPMLISGGHPAPPAELLVAIPLAVAALSLALLSVTMIGIAAVWLHDTSPVYWIWQKLAFIFGGLMLPLEIYPDWLRTIALFTPFSAMVNGPGRAVFGEPAEDVALTILRIGAWLALACVAMAWLWGRAQRALDAHGS